MVIGTRSSCLPWPDSRPRVFTMMTSWSFQSASVEASPADRGLGKSIVARLSFQSVKEDRGLSFSFFPHFINMEVVMDVCEGAIYVGETKFSSPLRFYNAW